jgi:hypothetical protein
MTQPIEVVRVSLKRNELTAKNVPALRELFGLEKLPLAETVVELEIKGVSTAIASAIRRAVTDEMPGKALQVPPDGFSFDDTTDPYMLPPYVNQRVSLIRLRSQISPDIVEGLELELDVSNSSTSVLSVYAGDMKIVKGVLTEPLFNPTYKLATLQPGKRIVIRGIRITNGFGRDDAVYNVSCCGVNLPLDVEQFTHAEMCEEKGPAADWSGYKVSSLVANPRHHLVRTILPATTAVPAESRVILVDACANIVGRLRRIAGAVSGSAALHGIRLTIAQLEGGLSQGVLRIPSETATIGAVLTRTLFEAGVSCVSHTGSLVITVDYAGDVGALISKSIQDAIKVFDTIRDGIAQAGTGSSR